MLRKIKTHLDFAVELFGQETDVSRWRFVLDAREHHSSVLLGRVSGRLERQLDVRRRTRRRATDTADTADATTDAGRGSERHGGGKRGGLGLQLFVVPGVIVDGRVQAQHLGGHRSLGQCDHVVLLLLQSALHHVQIGDDLVGVHAQVIVYVANGPLLALRLRQQLVGLGHQVIHRALGTDHHIPHLIHFLTDAQYWVHLPYQLIDFVAPLRRRRRCGGRSFVARPTATVVMVVVVVVVVLFNDCAVHVRHHAYDFGKPIRHHVYVKLQLPVNVGSIAPDGVHLRVEQLGYVQVMNVHGFFFACLGVDIVGGCQEVVVQLTF